MSYKSPEGNKTNIFLKLPKARYLDPLLPFHECIPRIGASKAFSVLVLQPPIGFNV